MSHQNIHLAFWISFVVLFLVVFTIDFRINRKRKGAKKFRSAITWTFIWITIALIYSLVIFFLYPDDERKITATQFIAGYLTEYSLSADNLFVFIMIFSIMGVKDTQQPRLLQLGILLSIVLRIIFIFFGIALISLFHWILYIFGAILLWTAYSMSKSDEKAKFDPEKNFLYRFATKIYPIDHDHNHDQFFIRKKGKLFATQLFLVFILIGSTDVLFAVDSIPAILGITQNPFVVITSNIFALMGLVSLFFALKSVLKLFRLLKYGVSFILFFIGLKMLSGAIEYIVPTWKIEEWFKINSWVSLTFIIVSLSFSILLSILIKENKKES